MKMEKTTVTMTITQELIDKGERYSCRYCPIAMWFDEVLKPEYFARVGSVHAPIHFSLNTGGGPTRGFSAGYAYQDLWLPEECAKFISRFDCRIAVEPFSAQVEIPTEFLKEEYIENEN